MGASVRATVVGTRSQPSDRDSSEDATSRFHSPPGKSHNGRSPRSGL